MSTTPTRPLPPEVRDKLGKLSAAAVVGTQRRAGRRSGGDRAGVEKQRPRLARSGRADHHTGASSRAAATSGTPDDDSDTVDAEELVDLVTRLRDSGAMLGSRSEEFLDGLLARARRYDAVFLSARQRQWLDDLARRAGVAS